MFPGPGLSSDTIEKGRNFKVISEIQQDGQNFIWSQHYPGGHSISNNFTVGKETEMETVGNKKFKVRACWLPFPPSPGLWLTSWLPPSPLGLLPKLRLLLKSVCAC